ncbi:hypothetical protein DVA76_18895, partial [Acinetobacter baumannii]
TAGFFTSGEPGSCIREVKAERDSGFWVIDREQQQRRRKQVETVFILVSDLQYKKPTNNINLQHISKEK